MDRDAYAEQLAGIGLDLAVRIRDESPDDAARVLDGLTHRQLRDLAVVLAAHVPVDLPRSVLTGWWTHPRRELAPCGTVTAAKRHQARGEEMCESCLAVYREHERVRARQRYQPGRERR